MDEVRARWAEFGTLVGSVALVLLIFVPWVRTGALQESDTVNGSDIPVLGWSSIIMCLITAGLAVAAVVLRTRWLWCVQLFAAALVVTGATLVLSALDVLDSAVLGWIMDALPESARATAPELGATFMLWVAYAVGLATVVLGSLAVVNSSKQGDPVDDDEFEMLLESPAWGQASPPLDPPTWMREL